MPAKKQFQQILRNAFPGFVVSLIALPLSLGLASASGAPPISGLISAIVGGMFVAIFGGSKVAIVGPGNGLVVVTLTAITTLGAGDMYQGFLYTLAAVVVSGVIIFLFGLFRFGALGDFFPSAAVQGMLAAIGVIIMAKQIHVMMGVMDPAASDPVGLLLSIPDSVGRVVDGEVPLFAFIFGIAALIFLFLYARVRNPVIKLIPAPMWVVIIGIGFTYFAQAQPQILAPLSSAYLVSLPDQVFSQMAFPDFSMWRDQAFISAVVALTFISTIESLLSMKAVDRLDSLKRRTNVNKGLRAIGMATVVSGFLGGLNVVKVIARSSVNVNQGATNRSSNFFHGFFLLLFILLFSAQLQRIPMAALAAILVFTGYKLCAPAVFRAIARVGWEQLAIFMVTMIFTLLTDLITGILIGIVVTLVAQLFAVGKNEVMLRNLFRPNTLLFKEDEEQYHLSVRAFSNFVNFLGIKKKLDGIPRNAKVIVDFSMAEFVDYSVLEQLDNYHQNFRSSGGDLEIIGVDNMASLSSHPFSPKRSDQNGKSKASRREHFSRRQKSIRLFAKKLDWQYNPRADYLTEDFSSFEYFQIRRIDNARNRLDGWQGRVKIIAADIHYYEGEYTARQHLHSTMVELVLPKNIPTFVLNKENLLDRVAHFAGFRDINFEKHPDFSTRFNLQGDDETAIRQFFDDDLILFFEENKAFHLESNGKGLLIFEKERLSTIGEIKQLISFANRLASLLNQKML